MKKALLILGCVLLTACASNTNEQVNFQPTAAESTTQITGKTFTLHTKDIRTAQYVALIQSGEEQVQPIHPRQNVRIALDSVFNKQMSEDGHTISVNSENTIELEIQQALIKVNKSRFKSDSKGIVELQVTAETPNGKFVKTYNGVGSKSGSSAGSAEQIEKMLNDITSLVLKEIAKDKELALYIKDNF